MKNRKEEQEVEENPHHKDHFEYDEDEDTYTCPEKKTLEFQKDAIVNGNKVSYYACQLKDCVTCSKNRECISTNHDRKKGYRTIVDDGFNLYRREMKARKASAPTRIAQAQAAEANLHPATRAAEYRQSILGLSKKANKDLPF